jgi:integrase
MGSIFRPKYKDRHGQERQISKWWIAYYSNGRLIREGTDTEDYEEARKQLKRKEGAAVDRPIKPGMQSIRFKDLAEAVIDDYVANERKSQRDIKQRFKDHILPAFGNQKATSIDTAAIKKYTKDRRAAGAAKATVNRELAAIKRAFNLGIQDERIMHRPHIPMLDEKDNVRTGYFEERQLAALLKHLGEDYGAIARFSFITGWRKSNVQKLKLSQVDSANGFISLEPGTTKNKKPVLFPITDELAEIIEVQQAKISQLKKQDIICPYLFFHFRTKTNGKPYKRNGKPIRDIKRAWDKARIAAGIPGRMLHDFRRTAVRNLSRSGITDVVAMQMTGHKTRSVYDRYNIVSEADLKEAAEKLNRHSKTAFKDGILKNEQKP